MYGTEIYLSLIIWKKVVPQIHAEEWHAWFPYTEWEDQFLLKGFLQSIQQHSKGEVIQTSESSLFSLRAV